MVLQAPNKSTNEASSQSFWGVKLHWLIIIPFIIQVGCSIGLSAWLAYRQGLSGIEEQAKKLLTSSSLNISTQLENYLLTPELVTETNSQSIELGNLNTALLNQWAPYLIKQSQLFPNLNFIYYGDQQGNYVHIDRHYPDEVFVIRFKDQTTNGQFKQFVYDLEGNLIPTPEIIENSLDQSYDPRPRPWYIKALEVNDATWTESYRFIDIKPNFGISHVKPIFSSREKGIEGVLGADFSLLGINQFLEQLSIGKSGKAFIIENSGSGNLIASSTPYPDIDNKRPTVWDIRDPIIQDTAKFLESRFEGLNNINGSRSLSFQSQAGKRYLLSVDPFQTHRGLDWLIIVAIPESDLTPALKKQNLYLGIICVLAWVLTILLGWLTAYIIAKALRKIQQGTIEIAQGNLSLRLDSQRLEEINDLTQSFNLMSQKLVLAKQRSFDSFKFLQQKVQVTETEMQSARDSWQVSEKNFRATFFSSPIPMIIVTLGEKRMIEVNEALIHASECDPSDIIGKRADDIETWSSSEKRQEIYDSLNDDGYLNPTEIQWISQAGQLKHILLSAQVIEFNQQQCALVAAKDITEQKKTELSLISAKQEAQKANQIKSEFLAHMSHELRTPLNAILGFSQLLSRGVLSLQRQNEYLSIIMRNGGHLLALINDVLDMSKIESGHATLNQETFSLTHFLRSIKETLVLKASKKGVRFYVEWDSTLPEFISTDQGKLRQILFNLLDNAIKYTPSGEVKFTVRPVDKTLDGSLNSPKPHTQTIYFSVQDTGPGISAAEIPTLFEPFVQTQTGKILQQGTGLGLAISYRFVQLMGGQLRVKSKEGEGSHFYFEIEVQYSQEQTPMPKEAKSVIGLAEQSSRLKMLIIDDHQDSAQLLQDLLMSIGFDVQSTTNPQVGVTLVKSWHPQLVWMDIKMPEMDGLTATKQIKQLQNAPIVVALTAGAFANQDRQKQEIGFDAFVSKPFQDKDIFETIRKYFKVDYIYQEDTTGDSATPKTEIYKLTVMPMTWIQELHAAAVRLDTEGLRILILEIPEEHSELKNYLLDLHGKFRYDNIIDLTQSHLET